MTAEEVLIIMIAFEGIVREMVRLRHHPIIGRVLWGGWAVFACDFGLGLGQGDGGG